MGEIVSIESDVSEQFEDFFREDDWSTFKTGADYYLNNAALILKKILTTVIAV